jgi:hypothetical protein
MSGLTEEEREALRARFHEMRMGNCPHPDLVPAPCDDLADWLAPAVERIVAERERAAEDEYDAWLVEHGWLPEGGYTLSRYRADRIAQDQP